LLHFRLCQLEHGNSSEPRDVFEPNLYRSVDCYAGGDALTKNRTENSEVSLLRKKNPANDVGRNVLVAWDETPVDHREGVYASSSADFVEEETRSTASSAFRLGMVDEGSARTAPLDQ